MDPKKLFIDDRLKGICIYCGRKSDSSDHAPSKTFLDEPYPSDLPVTECCVTCNQGFSVAEEYVACFLECVINGATATNDKFRPKIAATLTARPSIAQKIEKTKTTDERGNLIWYPELAAVRQVVLKLARGHIAYELGLHRNEEPEVLEIFPLPLLNEEQAKSFFTLSSRGLYPEIGSRAFMAVYTGKKLAFENWRVIQENRYQYVVGQGGGDWVKLVIGNYLACHVAWD